MPTAQMAEMLRRLEFHPTTEVDCDHPSNVGYGELRTTDKLILRKLPTVRVDLRDSEQFSPAFRAINPECTVPVLELNAKIDQLRDQNRRLDRENAHLVEIVKLICRGTSSLACPGTKTGITRLTSSFTPVHFAASGKTGAAFLF